MKTNKKDITSLFINIVIFINTVIITTLGVIRGPGKGQVGSDFVGIKYFKPYTIDSNVLMGVASLLLIVFLIIKLVKKTELPTWVNKIYYICTTTIILTFITVVLFLTPTLWIGGGFKSAAALYLNDMFFFHVANPILATVSFFLMKKEKLAIKDNFLAIIPMVIYSIVYSLNVAVFKTWPDFYGFTFGGKIFMIPIALITMYSAIYMIGFVLRKARK